MLTHVRVISPHSDDAALSTAPLLQSLDRKEVRVEIISCFTRSAWAPNSNRHGDAESVTVLRSLEHERFMSQFGGAVTGTDLRLMDAPLRRPGRSVFDARGSTRRDEKSLAAALGKRIVHHAAWVLPLGLGDHVDHLICRDTCVGIAAGQVTIFYEDIPYALRLNGPEISRAAERVEELIRQPLIPIRMKPESSSWCRGVRCYESQFSPAEVQNMLGAYKRRNGSRIWCVEEAARGLGALINA